MKVELDVQLDPTLGCGQAHRWRKKEDGSWEGVLGDSIVVLRQEERGMSVEGCSERRILDYMRADDDVEHILADISEREPYVAGLIERCPGMRILRQDRWECLATYLLATNANVARIGKMVESVCTEFGTDLGGRSSFPTPKQILDGRDRICACRLGFREPRLIELAERVESGDIDPDAIAELGYEECCEALIGINGVGPKVADCVALFAYGHLEAFPIDARISKVMETVYGVTGGYRKVADEGRRIFGPYAGYAQEFLYHSQFI
ncbi:MAG: hypothetical protein IKR86_02985 [Candidatus Methanomethylophilaceae archaeon]|nr:hypothetical protein [Candidatus Methanomethylophilaceae archaeon]